MNAEQSTAVGRSLIEIRATRGRQGPPSQGSRQCRPRSQPSLSGSHNVYQLTAAPPAVASPAVVVVEPAPGSVLCAGKPIALRANANYPGWPSLNVPDGSITWWANGSTFLGTGRSLSTTLPQGAYTLTVRAFDDASLSATVGSTVVNCAGSPPTATISYPPETGGAPDLEVSIIAQDHEDAIGFYIEITLEGAATDPEDGTLGGASLVWATDRGDLQPNLLGTGNSITVRLYAGSWFVADHTITLTATDSDGNSSAAVRVISVHNVIF